MKLSNSFDLLGNAGGGGAGAEFDEFDGEGRFPLKFKHKFHKMI